MDPSPYLQRERNPVSRQKHASEVVWQITLPLVLCGLLLLVISALSVGLGPGDASRWGSISLIWLIIPVMLAALIVFILLVAASYVIVKITRFIPGAAFRVQRALNQVGDITLQTSNRAVEPFIRLHTLSASIKRIRFLFFHHRRPDIH
jgi:hypothetical protein